MLWFGCGAHTNRTRPADMTAHAEVVADGSSPGSPIAGKARGHWVLAFSSGAFASRASKAHGCSLSPSSRSGRAGSKAVPPSSAAWTPQGKLGTRAPAGAQDRARAASRRPHDPVSVDVRGEPGTGLGGRGVVPRSATLAQGFQVGHLRGDPSAEPKEGVAKLRNPFLHAGLRGRVGGRYLTSRPVLPQPRKIIGPVRADDSAARSKRAGGCPHLRREGLANSLAQ